MAYTSRRSSVSSNADPPEQQGCAASEDRIYLNAGGNPDAACRVLHFDGRLYLFETVSELGDEFEDDEASTTVTAEMKAEIKAERDSVGKRVFALSLQGETLQVWRPEHTDPILKDHWIYNMCTLSSGHGRLDQTLILRHANPQRFVALYGV